MRLIMRQAIDHTIKWVGGWCLLAVTLLVLTFSAGVKMMPTTSVEQHVCRPTYVLRE